MTYKPIGSGIRLANYHLALRLVAAIIATHIIVAYGEKESFFELLMLPEYYPAFAGSFIIAFLLIEAVYRASKALDDHLSPDATILNHALLQLLVIVIPASVFAYILAALYFMYMGANILETSYIRYDYPFIVSKIIILNFIYFYYYSHKRRFVANQLAPDDQKLIEIETETNELGHLFEISNGLKIPLDEVCYIYHDGNSTKVYNSWGKEPLVCFHSLNSIEKQIGGKSFTRINRRMIVSSTSIKEVKTINRRLELILEPPFNDQVLVSQLHTPGFKAWYGINGRKRS